MAVRGYRLRLVRCASRLQLPKLQNSTVPVQLYGASPQTPGATCVGGPVLGETRRLGVRVPQNAFDFLTVAMAVTAADTFVLRADADDGWCRDIRLVVPVGNPVPWLNVAPILERALFFLSGDVWKLEITGGRTRQSFTSDEGRIDSHSRAQCGVPILRRT